MTTSEWEAAEDGRAEAEANAARFRLLFDRSPVGNAILTQKGQLLLANQALAELLGYPLEELEGRGLSTLIPGQDASSLLPLAPHWYSEPSPSSKAPEPAVVIGLRRDGARLVLSVTLTPLPSLDGKEPDILMTVLDLSDAHQARTKLKDLSDALARSNEELENFNRAAAHDLQTPLRGIRNLVSWLREDLGETANERVLHNLSRLTEQTHRMQMLINGLLSYSRVSTLDLKVSLVKVEELIRAEWAVLRPPKGFELRLKGEMPTLSTASTPLQQVLRNLLDNALKHHDRPQGWVEVSVEDQGAMLRFTVRDDGPGIPPDYHATVFDFLRKLRTQREGGGSGLGLTLVSRIVQRIGGACGLESDGGRGCSFWFTWPKVLPSGRDEISDAP